uniref:Uncharacterized protein n=1 Tax=Tetranychus urticae TaxID=32264 RepID=T1KYP1_TETUR
MFEPKRTGLGIQYVVESVLNLSKDKRLQPYFFKLILKSGLRIILQVTILFYAVSWL